MKNNSREKFEFSLLASSVFRLFLCFVVGGCVVAGRGAAAQAGKSSGPEVVQEGLDPPPPPAELLKGRMEFVGAGKRVEVVDFLGKPGTRVRWYRFRAVRPGNYILYYRYVRKTRKTDSGETHDGVPPITRIGTWADVRPRGSGRTVWYGQPNRNINNPISVGDVIEVPVIISKKLTAIELGDFEWELLHERSVSPPPKKGGRVVCLSYVSHPDGKSECRRWGPRQREPDKSCPTHIKRLYSDMRVYKSHAPVLVKPRIHCDKILMRSLQEFIRPELVMIANARGRVSRYSLTVVKRGTSLAVRPDSFTFRREYHGGGGSYGSIQLAPGYRTYVLRPGDRLIVSLPEKRP